MKINKQYMILIVIFLVVAILFFIPRKKIRTFDDLNIDYCKRFKIVTLGYYEQDGDESNGKEPIDWYIIDEDNDSYLLTSKDVIVSIWYNLDDSGTTWDKSVLRIYLNQFFYTDAFDEKIREFIKLTNVKNNYISKFGHSAGPDTYDRIFVFSTDELHKYFQNDKERISCGTKFGELLGLQRTSTLPIDEVPVQNASYYWTRTPGKSKNDVACVSIDGHINYYGFNGKTNGMGARPCIWIKKEAIWNN